MTSRIVRSLTVNGTVTNHFRSLTLPTRKSTVRSKSVSQFTGSDRDAFQAGLRTLPGHKKEITDHVRLRRLQREPDGS